MMAYVDTTAADERFACPRALVGCGRSEEQVNGIAIIRDCGTE